MLRFFRRSDGGGLSHSSSLKSLVVQGTEPEMDKQLSFDDLGDFFDKFQTKCDDNMSVASTEGYPVEMAQSGKVTLLP